MADSESDFSLKVVLVSFKQCLNEAEEVQLDHYLAGWRGLLRCVHETSARRRALLATAPGRGRQVALCPGDGGGVPCPEVSACAPHRFLNSLGAIFSFISKDVATKVQIMEGLRGGPGREHYSTLQSMVAYEVGHKLVDLERRACYPDSGCRTVLRLHRALRWLQLFLEGLRTSPEDTSTATLCTESYNASLAAFHPWIVRRAVTVAFCTLPARRAFLEAMNVGPPEQAVEMLAEALPFIERVYSISQKLYAEHALLGLP